MLFSCISSICSCNLNLYHFIFLSQFTFNLAYIFARLRREYLSGSLESSKFSQVFGVDIFQLYERIPLSPLGSFRGKIYPVQEIISNLLTFLTQSFNTILRLSPLLNVLVLPLRIFYFREIKSVLRTLGTRSCSLFVLLQGETKHLF